MATRLAAANRIADNGRMPVAYPPDADVYLPLKTSIVGRGMLGAINYTRATTATVTNNEGYVKPVLSGEVRFQNARRVQNLFSYSQEADNAYWTKGHCTIIANAFTAPDGTMTMDKIVGTATGTSYILRSMSVIAGRKYRMSIYGKANGQDRLEIKFLTNLGSAVFNMSTGTITSLSGLASNATITSDGNGIYRMSTLLSPTTTVAEAAIFSFFSSVGDQCYIWGMQLEDVTEQSNRSVGEYVSTNVLSGAFHGAFVDGVKYFDTDINGTPIPKSILKGFLCEGARTNLFLQSEDFSTTWGYVGAGAITTNQAISPSGEMNADLFTLAASLGSQGMTQSVTTTGSIYAQSVYVKPNGHNYVQCNAAAAISLGYVNFDLSNGTVGSSSLWTGTIESLPDGWYRLRVITNTVSAATANVSFSAVPSSTAIRGQTAAGTGTSGFYLWGAQFELGPNVSSYIPTTTTTATRNADVLTYDVRNAIANQGALSLAIHLNDSVQFDRRALNLSGFTATRLHVQARSGGASTLSIIYGDGSSARDVTGVAVGTNNIAVAWTNGVGLNLYMNNIKYIGAFVPSLAFSTIDVGGGSIGYQIFGCVRDIRIWKTRPTDDELLLLSNNP